jgi:hypothetical protein
MLFILFFKSKSNESGQPPTTAQMQDLMSFYSAMNKAGVIMGAEGLHPSSVGARVEFHAPSAEPTVVPGPFTPADSLVAGYWVIQVTDLAAALEWAKKCPLQEEGATIEVRRITEMGDDIAEGSLTEETKEQLKQMRRETEERANRVAQK